MSEAKKSEDQSEDWMKVLDRLPFVSSIKRDLTALRRLLYDRRAPRIAAIGMPASGRTSLVNALLSALTFGDGGAAPAPSPGHWVHIDADGRRLDWLELPAELSTEELSELARRAFEEHVPDLVIAAVASDAEPEHVDVLRERLASVLAFLADQREKKPPVIALLTKADRLSDREPPYAPETMAEIDRKLGELRTRLSSLSIPKESFLGVASDLPRWNVGAVAEEILARLPEAAQLEAVRAFEVGKESRRGVARTLVNSCTALAVTIGLAPIPFADAFVLLPLQGAMVTGVAYLSGRPWNRRAGAEWLASLGVAGGAGMGLRWGAQQLAKLIPGAGTIVGAGVAGAGTLAIGRSAIAYFIDGPGAAPQRPELRAENP
jgi:uncharacterized protein (DUF697 family)